MQHTTKPPAGRAPFVVWNNERSFSCDPTSTTDAGGPPDSSLLATTIRIYPRVIADFARYFSKPRDQLEAEHIKYHSDETEILNAGARSPAQQNFCLGVWQKTGGFTYQVNHFALNYNATTGALIGKIIVIELVTVSPGGTAFSGTFVETVFDPMRNQTDHLTDRLTLSESRSTRRHPEAGGLRVTIAIDSKTFTDTLYKRTFADTPYLTDRGFWGRIYAVSVSNHSLEAGLSTRPVALVAVKVGPPQ